MADNPLIKQLISNETLKSDEQPKILENSNKQIFNESKNQLKINYYLNDNS